MKLLHKGFVASAWVCLVFLGTVFAGCQKKGTDSKVAEQVQEGTKSRIVVLDPAGAEILCAIGAGDCIVARTDFCDFPQELGMVPSVGGFDGKTLSVETILGYSPDLVHGSVGMHDFLRVQLEQDFGVQMHLYGVQNLAEINAEIEDLGKLTGHEDGARKLNAKIAGRLGLLNRNAGEENGAGIQESKKVYFEVWNNPYMSVGKKSFIEEIVEKGGGQGIFADLEMDYPQVSEEAIISRNPEVILIQNTNGLTEEDVMNRPGWENIDAVKNDRVFIVDADVFTRPGPRYVDAVEKVAELLK